ncbi:MAG: hypothetical protein HY365_00405 [Candidatus Aenigmarchaeota archaeon]|nr:hypothetical protein [Candidatus Aenigmarchaeota archaeon]
MDALDICHFGKKYIAPFFRGVWDLHFYDKQHFYDHDGADYADARMFGSAVTLMGYAVATTIACREYGLWGILVPAVPAATNGISYMSRRRKKIEGGSLEHPPEDSSRQEWLKEWNNRWGK